MTRVPTRRSITVLLSAAALAAGALGSATVAQAGGYEDPTMNLPRKTGKVAGVGPHHPYVQEILTGRVTPLKNQAIINRTKYGYLFRGGQQHNNLTVTKTRARLRFHDTGTASWKWLPRPCTRLAVAQGVAASCRIPAHATRSRPMLLEVWPRLGNDVVDTTALPALVDVSFLGDKGDDVARFGAGDDFFNGAQDDDRAYGGGGRDWIRTGLGDDYLHGGPGGDVLVGVHNNDVIHGGPGNDRMDGNDGADQIFAGGGKDFAVCGNGADKATIDADDRAIGCETIFRF